MTLLRSHLYIDFEIDLLQSWIVVTNLLSAQQKAALEIFKQHALIANNFTASTVP